MWSAAFRSWREYMDVTEKLQKSNDKFLFFNPPKQPIHSFTFLNPDTSSMSLTWVLIPSTAVIGADSKSAVIFGKGKQLRGQMLTVDGFPVSMYSRSRGHAERHVDVQINMNADGSGTLLQTEHMHTECNYTDSLQSRIYS